MLGALQLLRGEAGARAAAQHVAARRPRGRPFWSRPRLWRDRAQRHRPRRLARRRAAPAGPRPRARRSGGPGAPAPLLAGAAPPRRASAGGARASPGGASSARAAAVGRRRRPRRHASALHVRAVLRDGRAHAGASRRLYAQHGRDRRLSGRGRRRLRAHARGPRERPFRARARVRLLFSAGDCGSGAAAPAGRARQGAHGARAGGRRGGRPVRAPRRARAAGGGPRRRAARRAVEGVQFGVHPLLLRRFGEPGDPGPRGGLRRTRGWSERTHRMRELGVMEQRIKDDSTVALKAGDKRLREALSSFVAALKKERIDSRKEPTEADELTVLKRERKRRAEAIGLYEEAGRKDLADQERYEEELLKSYMPEELGDAELLGHVRLEEIFFVPLLVGQVLAACLLVQPDGLRAPLALALEHGELVGLGGLVAAVDALLFERRDERRKGLAQPLVARLQGRRGSVLDALLDDAELSHTMRPFTPSSCSSQATARTRVPGLAEPSK